MAQAKFSFYQSGLSNYLRVIARKASDPLVNVDSQTFPPVLPTSINIEFDGLDPEVYKFFFYSSPDGVVDGLLISVFTIDVRTNIIASEIRFYRGGGDKAYDPAPGTTIADAYLDGLTIKKVFKEGFRFLEPGVDYEEIAGGGIEMLNGLNIAANEVLTIEIDYLVNQVTTAKTSFFDGIATIVNNTTLDSTYLNKRIRCESVSSRLVVTLALLSTVPDGKFLYFTQHGGSQKKTKFITQGAELIKINGQDLAEVSIGVGEILWMEKRGNRYEAVSEVSGMLRVGEGFSGMINDHPNCIPKDGRLIDGDDEPRLYWWIMNKLPATSRISVTEAIITLTYTHPVGKEGLYVVSLTSKKFRMPNTQGWAERALKDFTTFNTDGTRTYDYAGGSMPMSIQEHQHIMHGEGELGGGGFLSNDNNRYSQGGGVDLFGRKLGSPDENLKTGKTGGPETTGKNIGVIHLVRA